MIWTVWRSSVKMGPLTLMVPLHHMEGLFSQLSVSYLYCCILLAYSEYTTASKYSLLQLLLNIQGLLM